MTRLATNGNGHRSRVCALHAAGSAWRMVMIDAGGAGGRARLLGARTLRAGDAEGVRAAMQEAGVDRLLRTCPAEHTVCRVQPAQIGDPEQTAAAMALIAEAELAGVAPAWRCAAGLIDDPRAGGEGLALLTAWRDAAPAPAAIHPSETWTTEIAALAQLKAGAGQLAIAATRASGVISLIASGARATVARTIREANDSADGWRAAVLAAADESCRQVGADVDLAALDPGAGLVWLDTTAHDALRARVQGIRADQAWLDEYGVALGAALLGASDDPARAPLAGLRPAAPALRRSLDQRVAATVASPRRAGLILAGALAVIALAPLLVAWGRLALLEAGAERAAVLQSEREAVARQAALYGQLEISRLPMTKLLADIAGATPPHVVIDRLGLARDQGLTLEGRVHIVKGEGEAEAPENPQQLITELERNLAATGVFGGVRVNRSEVSAGSVLFEITARIDRPTANPRPAIDYAERPLAQRLYGERGENTARPVALGEAPRAGVSGSRRPSGSASPGPSRAARADEDEEGPGAPDASTRRPDGEGGASEDGVPPELTDAQISAMDRGTALREMVARMNARSRSGVDEGVKARLEAEIDKLRAQSRGEGGG